MQIIWQNNLENCDRLKNWLVEMQNWVNNNFKCNLRTTAAIINNYKVELKSWTNWIIIILLQHNDSNNQFDITDE